MGSERIDEVFDTSISVQRTIDLYKKRLKVIQDRHKLTDVWKDGEITEHKEYAILTNEIYKN